MWKITNPIIFVYFTITLIGIKFLLNLRQHIVDIYLLDHILRIYIYIVASFGGLTIKVYFEHFKWSIVNFVLFKSSKLTKYMINLKKWALALWVWGDDVFNMFVYIYINWRIFFLQLLLFLLHQLVVRSF
jgi:hypothetical protein